MPRKYTLEGANQLAIEMLSQENLSRLYKVKAINFTGNPIGSADSYQELFAQKILAALRNREIPNIRKSGLLTYCERERTDTEISSDNEEKVQRDFFFGRRQLPKQYGNPVWFELQTGERGQGKGVDLVYYNPIDREIHIFELKYKNHSDTLLHAILEIQTYYQRINWLEAQRDLQASPRGANMVLPCTAIKKHLLIDKESFNAFELNYKFVRGSGIDNLMREFMIDIVLY